MSTKTQNKRMRPETPDNLLTIGEWVEWAYKRFGLGVNAGMTGLEQAYMQSVKYKVCVSCLADTKIVLQTGRGLIKSTDHYMCIECLDYYANKD